MNMAGDWSMNRVVVALAHVFEWIVSASAMAAVTVVLIVLAQRLLWHRLKPRWLYLTWIPVILRLILPWRPESAFSVYNLTDYFKNKAAELSPLGMIDMQRQSFGIHAPEQQANLLSTWTGACMAVWLLGVCSLAAYTFATSLSFARSMRKSAVGITDPEILSLFERCKAMMNIQKPIGLVKTGALTSPALFGFRKPQLIVPEPLLERLSPVRLQHVLLHELAHAKRNDVGMNWLMHGLLVLHWFNPALWYAYRRIREDQEVASDSLALSCLTPDHRTEYGHTLIELSAHLPQRSYAPGLSNLSASKTQLKRRIQMIKTFKTSSYRRSLLGLAAFVVIAGCSLTDASTPDHTNTASTSTSTSVQTNETATNAQTDTASTQTQTDQTGQTDQTEQTANTTQSGSGAISSSSSSSAQTNETADAAKTGPADAAVLTPKPPTAALAEKPSQAAVTDATTAPPVNAQAPGATAPSAKLIPKPPAGQAEQQQPKDLAGPRLVEAPSAPTAPTTSSKATAAEGRLVPVAGDTVTDGS